MSYTFLLQSRHLKERLKFSKDHADENVASNGPGCLVKVYDITGKKYHIEILCHNMNEAA